MFYTTELFRNRICFYRTQHLGKLQLFYRSQTFVNGICCTENNFSNTAYILRISAFYGLALNAYSSRMNVRIETDPVYEKHSPRNTGTWTTPKNPLILIAIRYV
jgi:hypothetical protein